MARPQMLGHLRVCRDIGGELVQATWPDGEPMYRTVPSLERALPLCVADAETLLEAEPETEELVVVDEAGTVVHRVESFAGVPF